MNAVAPIEQDIDRFLATLSSSQSLVVRRELLVQLEERLQRDADAVGPGEFVTRHHFAPGTYSREIELPAGSCVIGKIHRHAHANVVSKGRALVATPDGVLELEAPYTFVSEPGTKRLVLAVTDVVWTTIHANPSNTTDLEELERQIIAPTFAALEGVQR